MIYQPASRSIGSLHDPRSVLLGACQRGGAPDALPKSLLDFHEWALTMERTVSLEPLPKALLDGISAMQTAYPEPESEPQWSTLRLRGGLYDLRYDKCPQGALPANFVSIGDASMRLDPVFAQGCGKAVIDVTTLDGLLRQVNGTKADVVPDSFTSDFFKIHAIRTRKMFDQTRLVGALKLCCFQCYGS
jgi:hypothetical protein